MLQALYKIRVKDSYTLNFKHPWLHESVKCCGEQSTLNKNYFRYILPAADWADNENFK